MHKSANNIDVSNLHMFSKYERFFIVHTPTGKFAEVGGELYELLGKNKNNKVSPDSVADTEEKKALHKLIEYLSLTEDDDAEENQVQLTDLTLNITTKCNLNCVYCWNQGGTYAGEETGFMNEETAFLAIDMLIEESRGAKDLVVDFYGGEPLLNFELMQEVIKYCQMKYKDKRFSFLLATNGTLLKPEVSKWLHENNVNVALSIDGNADVQNRQRPFCGGKPSFGTIFKNLENFEPEAKKELVGRATLTPAGPDPFTTWIQLENLGFKRIEVFESEPACFGASEYSAKNFYINEDDRERLKKGYENLLIYIAKRIGEGELEYRHLFFSRLFKQMARLYRYGDFQGPCAAGLGQVAVSADGTLYPCTAFIGQKEWEMGTVFTGINRKVQAVLRNADITKSEMCRNCWAKNLCLGSGSCFNINYLNNGDITKPVKEFCELYRFKIELLIAGISIMTSESPERFDKLFTEGNFEDRTAWQAS